MTKPIKEERRKKEDLRKAIDYIENFLNKLKKIKSDDFKQEEIDACLQNLEKIIKAIRGYHLGVTNLISSFDMLFQNLQNLKTGELKSEDK